MVASTSFLLSVAPYLVVDAFNNPFLAIASFVATLEYLYLFIILLANPKGAMLFTPEEFNAFPSAVIHLANPLQGPPSIINTSNKIK